MTPPLQPKPSMRYDPAGHHRRSIRLRGYNYAQEGAYFVTICVLNHECLLGEIIDGEMRLNTFGEIIKKCWHELPNYYTPLVLDEFIVMPNHLHGILVISDVGAASRRPSELRRPSESQNPDGRDNLDRRDNPVPTRTLGQLIGYYKFQCTKEINTLRGTEYAQVLQRGYYEHIIRNEHEWNAIADYIRSNPANWSSDADNEQNFANRPRPKSSNDYWRDIGLL